jgi:hypothetical protein
MGTVRLATDFGLFRSFDAGTGLKNDLNWVKTFFARIARRSARDASGRPISFGRQSVGRD